jgi:hypothetical protein
VPATEKIAAVKMMGKPTASFTQRRRSENYSSARIQGEIEKEGVASGIPTIQTAPIFSAAGTGVQMHNFVSFDSLLCPYGKKNLIL